jgi:hypothetical protein
MDMTELRRTRRRLLLAKILRGLFFYGVIPVLLLWLLAGPIRDAVRRSPASVWWILPAALAAVGVNWYVCAALRRKPPSLPVYAHGVFCLMTVLFMGYGALPGNTALSATLATLGSFLALMGTILISFWFAEKRSKAARACALTLWVLVCAALVGMAYQILRDFESGRVTGDTWITIGILAAVLLALNGRKIRRAYRRHAARRRRTGLTTGRIVQVIGESRLDLEEEMVTRDLCRVRYEVDGTAYETRARIFDYTVRKFGRQAFIGQEVPVRYDPANPGDAFVRRVDRHIFDTDRGGIA